MTIAAKRSKFNVRTDAMGKLRRTLDGVLYDSAAERDYAARLELEHKTGRIKAWHRQSTIHLEVNEVIVCKIVADFLVIHNDKSYEYIEVKGHETALWKLKYKLLKALYPRTRYTVVHV